MSKRHKQDGVDIGKLLDTTSQQLMWQYVQMAKFLNMSYLDVKELPFDEFEELQRIMQISSYLETERGHEILKDNIRYMSFNPDTEKLSEKFGKEGGV